MISARCRIRRGQGGRLCKDLQQEKIRTAKESPSIPGMPEPLPKPPDPVELLDGYHHALLSGKGIEQALLALRVRVQEDVQRRLS